ncbi:MAG: 16S rRNA (cytosine(967)-C(5))-methyltransferase RsmB [Oscillatoriales cyanobacterium SM2_2_1]|nr:16S rRNA (cytosine(967)-C(5))-methyltransferase RsmB [Oscillatoriales cyanobacterium SM2_2_1]
MSSKKSTVFSPRYGAVQVLRAIADGAYADGAFQQFWQRQKDGTAWSAADRALVMELVYGVTRRRRTLSALIRQFCQPEGLPLVVQLILQLGVYQLGFSDRIHPVAAVDSSVSLCKEFGFTGLAGLVNAVLRKMSQVTLTELVAEFSDWGDRYSLPDWLVNLWLEQFDRETLQGLGGWVNGTPYIDVRVNRLRGDRQELARLLEADPIPHLGDGLRLRSPKGPPSDWPYYQDGWWSIQDASAQLAVLLLDPQPGEWNIDACAAPGGKTTYMAERMGDRGTILALDRTAARLRRLQENTQRLGLTCIEPLAMDCLNYSPSQLCDRLLLDVPCSGLGTLQRHADARWQQNPTKIAELVQVQRAILRHTAAWVKPGGYLVYATCTLNRQENGDMIGEFLADHPQWHPELLPQEYESWAVPYGLEILPHRDRMDGFFMSKLRRD